MASAPPAIRSRPLTLVFNVPVSKTQKFWDGIKEGKIYTTRCKKCQKLSFPPIGDCPTCLSSDMEWVELGEEAEIETFTYIPIKPASFQSYDNYTIAIAKLNEGVRVLAWLTDAKLEDVKVGMKVKLAAKVRHDGTLTYEFKPLSSR